MTAKRAYRRQGWRRFAAKLGLAGLLLQAIFPILLAGLTPARAGGALWDQVVLCTADGLKTVSLADLAGGEQPQTPQNAPEKAPPHAPFCPACPGYFQAHAAITPTILLAAAPSRRAIADVRPADQRGPAERRFTPQSARAPPSFA